MITFYCLGNERPKTTSETQDEREESPLHRSQVQSVPVELFTLPPILSYILLGFT